MFSRMTNFINKSLFIKMSLMGGVIVFALGIGAASAHMIKIGAVAPKTGPLAVGASITHWPNIKLWVSQVNGRGGLRLKDGARHKIELITYDDQTNPTEHIKATIRLATLDKVDFIVAPYGTGFNVAAAPHFAKYGYPQITSTSITDKIPQLTKRFPGLFFTLGNTTSFVGSLVNIMAKLRDQGKIGNRVAMVNVAADFGIELRKASIPIFKKAGFKIVFDKSYPLGTQDLSPVMRGVKASNPDAFVAWSYPPDTIGLTKQAKIQNLEVKVYYSAVATAFPVYLKIFGKSIEGVLGAGGLNLDTPALQTYMADHKRVTGKTADFWASPVAYATLQVLEQAIEAVGSTDRKAVTAYIKKGTFTTVMGTWKFKNQVIPSFWTVGQWQNGKFYGVASTGMPGERPVAIKRGW